MPIKRNTYNVKYIFKNKLKHGKVININFVHNNNTRKEKIQ